MFKDFIVKNKFLFSIFLLLAVIAILFFVIIVFNKYTDPNRLVIGSGVSKEEIAIVHGLLRDGDPLKRENKVLRILKLDDSCNVSTIDRKDYYDFNKFKECSAGDIYVQYGYDICFKGCDSTGYRRFEYYRINKIDGKWSIIEKFKSLFSQ